MTLDQTIGALLVFVLISRLVDLGAIYQKLRQTSLQIERFGSQRVPSLTLWLKYAIEIFETFALWVMGYFLFLFMILGLLYQTMPAVFPYAALTFRASIGVSIVTILSAMIISVLNLFVEKCRTSLEQLS